MRGIHLDGSLDDTQNLASTGSMRASGFPRLVRQGDRLVVAWMVTDDEGQRLGVGVIGVAAAR